MLVLSNPVIAATQIVVAAVGDVLLHEVVQRHVAASPHGFDGLWSEVAGPLRQADLCYANLEGPAADGVGSDGAQIDRAVSGYDGYVYSGYPLFNYPSAVAAALARAGVGVVSTANNHALDRFAEGIERTLAALSAAGLRPTGTRSQRRPRAPWHAVTEIRGYRLAWLAATYGTNGIEDRRRQVLMCHDQRAEILDLIAGLAADPDLDAVIFLPHWGQEYSHHPLQRQRLLARDAIDAGAAAVIGNHPHVVQPLETWADPAGRQGLIAYSLGNFVSNQRSLPCRSSAVLLLSLAEGHDGRLHASAVRWLPIAVDFSSQSIRVRPAEGSDSANLVAGILGKEPG